MTSFNTFENGTDWRLKSHIVRGAGTRVWRMAAFDHSLRSSLSSRGRFNPE